MLLLYWISLNRFDSTHLILEATYSNHIIPNLLIQAPSFSIVLQNRPAKSDPTSSVLASALLQDEYDPFKKEKIISSHNITRDGSSFSAFRLFEDTTFESLIQQHSIISSNSVSEDRNEINCEQVNQIGSKFPAYPSSEAHHFAQEVESDILNYRNEDRSLSRRIRDADLSVCSISNHRHDCGQSREIFSNAYLSSILSYRQDNIQTWRTRDVGIFCDAAHYLSRND